MKPSTVFLLLAGTAIAMPTATVMTAADSNIVHRGEISPIAEEPQVHKLEKSTYSYLTFAQTCQTNR
jgi:hypothetical protein